LRIGAQTCQHLLTITRYAFLDRSPAYQVARPESPLSFVRNLTAYKAFDLLANPMRRIGLVPGTAIRSSARPPSYVRSILHHLWHFFLNFFIFDAASYLVFRLAPMTFGHPTLAVGGDFRRWCRELASQSGLPIPAIWLFWEICQIIKIGNGTCLAFHLFAIPALITGLYRPEEWPRLMHQPVKSSSLNELWGTRYHQVRRSTSSQFCPG